MNTASLTKALSITDFLSAYHNYSVVGLENIPQQGPALIVINHSLATYDGILLARAIYRKGGRICRTLGDKTLFRFPILSTLCRELCVVEGTPSAGEKLLEEGHLVIVAPGGMREALKPSSDFGKLFWEQRRGFVRLALKMKAPVILAACPNADKIYQVYPSQLTQRLYEKFKLPLPFARGIGLSFVPRPIDLCHSVRAPFFPPSYDEEDFEGATDLFHSKLTKEMTELMVQT